MNPPPSMRLDKWLWVARFFKTRPLAQEAVMGGKVHLDGRRTKPGREIRPGMRLTIHKGELAWEIEVLALDRQRRPAAEAALLYREDEGSVARRQALLAHRRLERRSPAPTQRPNKKERRLIHRFKQGDG